MYETYERNPDALAAEIAYRRARLMGSASHPPAPRGRWWRRRTPTTD